MVIPWQASEPTPESMMQYPLPVVASVMVGADVKARGGKGNGHGREPKRRFDGHKTTYSVRQWDPEAGKEIEEARDVCEQGVEIPTPGTRSSDLSESEVERETVTILQQYLEMGYGHGRETKGLARGMGQRVKIYAASCKCNPHCGHKTLCRRGVRNYYKKWLPVNQRRSYPHLLASR
ncbi:hypothetical protein P692DRAFT_201803943 [Suillus brevipes Sb2]|nr:hypothetical protein P692DRAFT_201803943 [Suillus brevipes Sb2]